MKKLLPVILAVFGLGVGGGAGYFLRPKVDPAAMDQAANSSDHGAGTTSHTSEPNGEATPGHDETAPKDYVKLNNQFIVPLVDENRVSGMIIMALSIEVSAGNTELVFAREPKLRDAFLQILFDHANNGGFRGVFTDGSNTTFLRKAMLEAAQKTLGDIVSDVLISDLARQDS
jgi:flagellar basal body-associated protein FliL